MHVKENIFLEDYVEVKKEVLKIRIVEEINENLVIENDLKVEMAETIEEEIKKSIVQDLDETKLGDCKSKFHAIL